MSEEIEIELRRALYLHHSQEPDVITIKMESPNMGEVKILYSELLRGINNIVVRARLDELSHRPIGWERCYDHDRREYYCKIYDNMYDGRRTVLNGNIKELE